MCLYIPLEWERYYESILSKIEKVLQNYDKKYKFISIITSQSQITKIDESGS
jgi:hypothetical protein